MKFRKNIFSLLLVYLIEVTCAKAQCPRSLKRDGCLTKEDMNSILSRWPRTFEGNFTDERLETLIKCTVSKDFKQYDKTFTFGQGCSGLLTDGRQEFIQEREGINENRKNSPNAPGGVFAKVFAFHGCNEIAFRFQYKGETSGKTKCTNTANTQRGIPIRYAGIDLLKIEPGSLLVQESITSADWINQFLPIGADFNGFPICPGTAPPPCDPDCGPCSAQRRSFSTIKGFGRSPFQEDY